MATRSQRKRRRSERLILNAAAAVDGPLRFEGEQPVEFQAAAGESKLPTFSMLLYAGGKMKPRGFGTPVVMDLATTTVAAGTRPFLFNHDPAQPVAHGDITVEAKAIRANGTMSVASVAGENIKASSANGFPWKSSVGAEVGRFDFVEAGKQVQVNGQKFNGPIYVARNNVVYEGSFVTLAGDNRSSATVAATLGDSAMTPFEKWLQAKGIELATLSDAIKITLQAAFDAETAPNPDPAAKPKKIVAGAGGAEDEEEEPDPIAELRASHAAELNRIGGIKKLFASGGYAGTTIKTSAGEHDLQAHAIAEGWTPEATELVALRASRPVQAQHSKSHDASATLQAMQGAVLLRAGVKLDNPMFTTQAAMALRMPEWIRAGLNTDGRQKAMEAAWRFRDMSMYDMAIEAIRLDGRDVPSGSREDHIIASFSGTSLSNIFTTNVNAVLLMSYGQAPDTTMGWCSEEDLPNFNTQERPRVLTGQGLEKLPAGGTASHDTDTDQKEQYKLARYARQFVIDEQDVLSDRFGKMKDKPTEYGKAAARLRPDLVYYILLSNPNLQDAVALFHSTHRNLNTGSALAVATLKVAISKFELQTENGVNLDLKMSHLLVPPTLKHDGKILISSSEVVTGENTTRGSRNTLADENLTLISDSRLENGVTDPDTGATASGSASTWFGASTMAHTIEVGYLRGTGRVPTSRSFTLDRGQWGMGWDIKHDIAAKALDFLGLQKNTA